MELETSEAPGGEEVGEMCRLAVRAGAEILSIRAEGAAVWKKADSSPVTSADLAAERVIVEGLRRFFPGRGVVAEEETAAGKAVDIGEGSSFFLVDALDGTRAFVRGDDYFTVNIALVESGAARMGVIYAPALGDLYYAASGGVWRRRIGSGGEASAAEAIQARPAPATGLVVAGSRGRARDGADMRGIEGEKIDQWRRLDSSLKFCLVASGEADAYVRPGRTMEWDTAAGHAIVAAAGGRVNCMDGSALVYGKTGAGYANPPFIVRGRRASDGVRG